MIECSERDGALMFSVRVVVRASRSGIIGEHDGALRVRIAAPPVDGAANEELIRVLAYELDIAPRNVEITGGHSSKFKHVRVTGVTRGRVESLLEGSPVRRRAANDASRRRR